MDVEEVVQLARDDARDAIVIARESNEPIAWITGNSYMPPLRAFGHAEYVYRADDDVDTQGELWEVYVEEFEITLANNDVYCACPDYDNALYVVDLRRWEYIENENGDMLSDDWQLIIADDVK